MNFRSVVQRALVGVGVTATGAGPAAEFLEADIIPQPIGARKLAGNELQMPPSPFLFDRPEDTGKNRQEQPLATPPQWSDETWKHLKDGHLGMLGELHPDDQFYIQRIHTAATPGMIRDPLNPNPAWSATLDLLRGIATLSQGKETKRTGSSLLLDNPEHLDVMFLVTERLERFALVAREVGASNENAPDIIAKMTLAIAKSEAARSKNLSLSVLSGATGLLRACNEDTTARQILKHDDLLRAYSETILRLHANGFSAQDVLQTSFLRLSALYFDIASKQNQERDAVREAIALQQDLLPELVRLHAIHPELPQHFIETVVVARPHTIEAMQETRAALKSFVDSLSNQSTIALSHLAKRGVYPSRDLLTALSDLYHQGGVSNLMPLMTRNPLSPETMITPLPREISLARCHDLEIRVGNILKSQRDPTRNSLALIVLTGTDTTTHMAEAIDDLYKRGFGLIICDGSVMSLEAALKPTLENTKAPPSIKFLLVVGEADISYRTTKRAPPFHQPPPPRPSVHSLTSPPYATRQLSPSEFGKQEVRRLLDPGLEILTVIDDDALLAFNGSKMVHESTKPAPVSEAIAEWTDRVVNATVGVDFSNLTLKVVSKDGKLELQACRRRRARDVAWAAEQLPFGAFYSRRRGPTLTIDVQDMPVVLVPNP